MQDKIRTIAKEINSEIIDIRRHIHKNPELSFNEKNTSAYISKKLSEWGIEHQTGIADNGILGIIKGEKQGSKTIALRADMDALPICEKNDVPFKSVNNNVMHACGHDIHTACLLGATKILQTLKSEFGGTVLLVFQPAEEVLPGGAKLMLDAGVFSKYKPDFMIAQHVCPDITAGSIGMFPSKYMASADEIYITVKSSGGHAALPHLTPDTVLATSHTIVALQQIVSRFIPTKIPSILSFGNIVCNSTNNVIPKQVQIQGTFRTMDEEWRYKAHKKITEIAKHTCQAIGADCDVEIKIGYPCVENNIELTNKLFSASQEFFGKEHTKMLEVRMTAEDFAWFAQQIPSCFYRLGVGYSNNTKKAGKLHSDTFYPNEEAIKTGMEGLSYFATHILD